MFDAICSMHRIWHVEQIRYDPLTRIRQRKEGSVHDRLVGSCCTATTEFLFFMDLRKPWRARSNTKEAGGFASMSHDAGMMAVVAVRVRV